MRTSLIAPLSLGLAVTVAGCSWFGGGDQNMTPRHEAAVTTDSPADRTIAPPNTATGTQATEHRSASNLSNQQVRQAQQKLQQLGLYKGRVDGIYGRQSIAAVNKFQSENGLPRTGALNSATEQKLQTAQANQPQNPQTAQQPAPNNQPNNPQTSQVPPSQSSNTSRSPNTDQNSNANPSATAPNDQPSH